MKGAQRRGEELYRIYPEASAEPADSADRDAIAEMERTPGYALVAERVNQEITRRSAELELPADIDSTQYIRGVLYGLRTALRIPSILKAEIQ